MNKPTVDTMTAAALRDLDPAPATTLTGAELGRAEATMARILRAPVPQHVAGESDRPRRRRRRVLVLVGLAGGAGATVLALLLGSNSALASWTSKPVPLTGAAATGAAATCSASLVPMADQEEWVVTAERRGDWTYVFMEGTHVEAACLMPNDQVGHGHAVDREVGFMGYYSSDPVEPPTMARDGLDETWSGGGSVHIRGWLPFISDDGWLSWVGGYVGTDVVGVTVHTPVGPDVEASVAHGRFSAWWPSHPPSSKHLDVMGAWTYSVTLADGSTREVPEND